MSVTPLPNAVPPLAPSRLDPASLLTRQDIERHLSSLTAQESELDARLAGLISSRARLSSHLKALESLRPVVSGIQGESAHMAAEIGAVAETAERVGAKVRGLDEEQVRISLSLEFLYSVLCKADQQTHRRAVESQGFDRCRASGPRPQNGHRKSRRRDSEARLGGRNESNATGTSY